MSKRLKKNIKPGKFPEMPKGFIFVENQCYVSLDIYTKLKRKINNFNKN